MQGTWEKSIMQHLMVTRTIVRPQILAFRKPAKDTSSKDYRCKYARDVK